MFVYGLIVIPLFWVSTACAEDIQDIKGPMAYPGSPLWPIMLFILVGVLGVFAGVWVYFKFFKKEPGFKPQVKQKTPVELALMQLEALINKGHLESGDFHLFYSELSDILRYFIEAEFLIKAPEMTTEEFLLSMERTDRIPQAHNETLKNFLQSADMVKFAKFRPSVDEAKKGLETAKQFIMESAQLKNDI